MNTVAHRIGRGASRPGVRAHPRASARKTAVGTLGILSALAAIEHGIGEVLQGSVRPEALVIKSWPDAQAMEILQGEPALTIVPNMLLSGILTIVVASGLAVWAVAFADHRHHAAVLALLSVVLLLVGGGFGPPLLGLVVAAGAMHRAPRRVGRLRRAVSSVWPWFLGAAAVGYLGLMPGTVLLSALASFESAGLTFVLAGLGFGGAILALIGARAHDMQAIARR